ncbi:MAG: DNA-directed RNA polymerase subunit B'' [Nanoarchaeota archaeon]
MNQQRILIEKYFEGNSFVESNIKSFNDFVTRRMQIIVNEMSEIIPTVMPQEMEEFKIKFDKIWITKPQLVEADGSKRNVYPTEARLRGLTYSSPLYLEVSAYTDGIQRETFTTEIGRLPIMVGSKFCHLSTLKKEELIKHFEDPYDIGGYFILNGNERVLVTVEDLASNKVFIQENKTGPSRFTARVFSERGAYRIPHTLEQMKDGIIYVSFTKYRRVPVIVVIKALGLIKDQEITNFITDEEPYDDIFINLFNSIEIKTEDDAIEFLAKKAGINQPKEIKTEKVRETLDKYLLPHLGVTAQDRITKAYNLCKIMRKFFYVSKEGYAPTDKDHYMNKRLRLSGDLMEDLFRVNFRILINDILYNFQRLVKRGKFSNVKIIIRDQLLTSRIQSAMSTGTWVGGRKGVSQNLDRVNFLSSLSHVQGVVSLLSSTQENFEARALHPTHWGKLCPIETPEGTRIGLRKNFAMLCSVTQEDVPGEKVKKVLETHGLKKVGI